MFLILSQIYIYQNYVSFIICGNFNARCGGEADYIEGIDVIQERMIVDYKKNFYGDLFIDFLIKCSCVMLNGRSGNNDFTSISTKGVAVVDYIFVSHTILHQFEDFNVHTAHNLFNKSALVGKLDPEHNIPDHSVLSWHVCLQIMWLIRDQFILL